MTRKLRRWKCKLSTSVPAFLGPLWGFFPSGSAWALRFQECERREPVIRRVSEIACNYERTWTLDSRTERTPERAHQSTPRDSRRLAHVLLVHRPVYGALFQTASRYATNPGSCNGSLLAAIGVLRR